MSKAQLQNILILGVFSGMVAFAQPPETAPFVDLESYTGHWEEIARIPNDFQKNCARSTAEYRLDVKGGIYVVNTCYNEKGRLVERVSGKATAVDQEHTKLRVGFFEILGWYPEFTKGDYWILQVGPKEDERGKYTYAVVGHPKRKYGWILARERTLPKETLDKIFVELAKQGYDRERFIFSSR